MPGEAKRPPRQRSTPTRPAAPLSAVRLQQEYAGGDEHDGHHPHAGLGSCRATNPTRSTSAVDVLPMMSDAVARNPRS
jgi:hypothetical protein